MELMLASLDDHNLEAEQQSLDRFYASVRRRVEGVRDAEGKQKVIVELYDNFFATAFKKTVDRLGIVYTPIEIVDFILRSADEVLRAEFGQGLTDEGVHILDGFTGTGTFIVRLLQSGLIEPHDLARKYANELHANEILLLAYYIAAVNIETTYAALANGDGSAPGVYEPFPGLVLTDTFQFYEDGDRDDLDIFPGNNERIERQRKLPITVIVGNPPYSVGQDSANDNNAEHQVPHHRRRDPRHLRGALHRHAEELPVRLLHPRHQVGIAADPGPRSYCLRDQRRFHRREHRRRHAQVPCRGVHLNSRPESAGQSAHGRRAVSEGGRQGFGGGSRATVAVTVLVKNPGRLGRAQVHYTDIGDYLTREEKLARVREAGSLHGLAPRTLEPNEHGDWLGERREEFAAFLPLGTKDGSSAVVRLISGGLNTSRDAWNYNSYERRQGTFGVMLLEKPRLLQRSDGAMVASGGEVDRDPDDDQLGPESRSLMCASCP